MVDETARICVEIFRKSTGLDISKRGTEMSDEDILSAPIDSFGIDSLETMEFIMAVEERFDVELSEEAVNRCGTLDELAALVVAERRV
jgi:acyl carrier protein